MNLIEIKNIIQQGENNFVEFKQRVSTDKNLAILISSFANSFGGKILIGITNNGKVRGVKNTTQLIAKIRTVALTRVKPSLDLTIEEVEIYNKNIIVVEIPHSKLAPHSAEGVYYHRKGRYAGIIGPEIIEQTIINRAHGSKNPEKVLADDVRRLIDQNVELHKKFTKANSWRSKIIDILIGALIGGIISILLQFIF